MKIVALSSEVMAAFQVLRLFGILDSTINAPELMRLLQE